jgi:hypothetical protein
MKTYTKQDFHNPEQLTRQQVGENYRLLLHEELDGRFRFEEDTRAQYFSINGASWHGCIDGASLSMVYRVPLATPLPDGTVLSSNECCWSDQPRKKRVYCAGPMSSYPKDYNFPAFYSAAESLEKQGYEPVNPAQLDIEAGYTLERIKQLDPAEFQEFLKGAAKRDLDALQQCDAIALLPGWESSKGARAEKAVAEWLGLRVYYLYRKNEFYQWAPLSKAEYYDLPSDKQPYNSDERAEWDVSDLIPKIQSSIASDDPKGAAGAKKAPMHLLPPNALIETAKAMGHGAAKYGAWNFIETTVCASTYVGALGRHWAAYARSEDIDPDSGLPHLALIAANCFVLLTAQQQGTLRDDRPKLRQI